MTDLHDHRPLSRIELMVLARLTSPKLSTQADIVDALEQGGLQLTEPKLTDCVVATLAALQGRALVVAAAPAKASKRAPVKSSSERSEPDAPRFTLTENGRAALRHAFGLKTTPTWKTTCGVIVPALVLGVAPGSESAKGALRTVEAMTATLLRRDRLLGEPRTVNQLCDQVIARALGMPPGPVTPAAIRAYALAVHCGVDDKSEFVNIAARFTAPAVTTTKGAKGAKGVKRAKPAKGPNFDKELKTLATRFAEQQLHASFETKASLVEKLRRHWLTQQDEADDAIRPAPSWTAPLAPAPPAASVDLPLPLSAYSAAPHADTGVALLTAVRDAIATIGSDGRFGKENVFVSALWRQIASDQRLPELSLDRFKRWLIAANRDQLVDLARADLVDAMDARLVEESEIEDLGSTFHFVIDRRELQSAPEQVSHAR